MTVFQAIILGIVQGLTEFLPISSQAHLLLLPYFLKWDYQGLNFDIALHWGTLAAVLVVFWKDYWRIIRAVISPLPDPPHQGEGKKKNISSPSMGEDKGGGDRKLAWFLIVATIPAAVLGYILKEQAETTLRNPITTVITLSVFAILMLVADRRVRGAEEGLNSLTLQKSLFIGFMQAMAIIPGVSRSGATITGGLFFGLSREAAARFSFLLSGPIIFGAGLFALQDLVEINSFIIAGFIASAVSGILAIKFLLKYLSTHDLKVFVWYRLALAGIILLSLIF